MNGALDFESEAPESKVSPPPTAPSPGDRVRALLGLGPIVRLQTGLPTFDTACRGGVPTRRLVVLGGAPSTGKTTLATNLAWSWAKAGHPVTMLAIDEGPEGVIARIAQAEGFNLDLLEERDPGTLERLADILDTTPLGILDGEDALGTVEGATAHLARRAGGKSAVLIVDSLQTVRAKGTEEAKSPRERVDCTVDALKLARDRHGFLVIATCELARGSYRNRNQAENIADLAAFKESGKIEYAAQTALVLRSVPDETNLVDVSVPKNRAYQRQPFRLKLDTRTAVFTEIDLPEKEKAGRRSGMGAQVEEDAHVLRRVLVEEPGIAGVRALRIAVRARGNALGNDRVDVALEYLRHRGELENRGTAQRPKLFLVTPSEASDDPA